MYRARAYAVELGGDQLRQGKRRDEADDDAEYILAPFAAA
jgi:hypothetical protein